ncbi:MAG: mevalonate kinase [Candidatus Aenigmarchaeota archaeon]|nr:mevalonate kinase [Candidatus Aenigmarchaeota archaeon]
MAIKASAPGNLFLFGEHAAVYGRPAICAAVGKRTEVLVSENNKVSVVIFSDAFGKAEIPFAPDEKIRAEKKELENVALFVRHIRKKFGITKGFDLKIASEVPVNSGMSSSTAVFCSILGALSAFAGKSLDKKEYFDIIFPYQAKVHGGKASGSEIVSSTFGGFSYIKKLKDGIPPKIETKNIEGHKFYVVIANTKVDAPTSLTVGYHVPSLIKRDSKFVYGVFDKIAEVAEEAIPALKGKNVEALGELMNENQKLLSSLGLSHPKLDDCIKEALSAGALGAKLSGGGWGGIMFALCREKDVSAVKKAIASTGAETIETEIGACGITVSE